MSQAPTVVWTYEDYLLFPADGQRYEILDGERYVTPAPSRRHQHASMNLSWLLRSYLDVNPIGVVYAAPFDLVLSDHDVVQPDLVYVSKGRSDVLDEHGAHAAPDLVIEILSESTRRTDEMVKRKLYERFGVAEFWICDPVLETIKVYRLVAGRFAPPLELALERADTVTTPLLPGLEIPLFRVFGGL
jgi:Uma2 family endonuclease